MGYTQAHEIIKVKLGDTKEIGLKQFCLIEAYLHAMKLADPTGTYYIETEPCSYLANGKQFCRLYVAYGATKNFWKYSRYAYLN